MLGKLTALPNPVTDGEVASCLLPQNPTSLLALRASDAKTPLTSHSSFFDNSHVDRKSMNISDIG